MPTNQISSAPWLQSTTTGDQFRYGDVPPEIALEEQALNRRQQLANLLMQRGMQPAQGQMAGRFYVPPSPIQGLSQLAQMAAGVYGTRMNDEERKALSGKSNQMVLDAMEKWKQAQAPTVTEQPMPSVPGTGGEFPATRAEMPDTFDIDALQGGPQVGTSRTTSPATRQYTGDVSQPMTMQPAQEMTGIPVREGTGMQPTSQTVPVKGPSSREQVAQALSEMQMSTHPQVRQFGNWQANQQAAKEEKEAQRTFTEEQKREDRQLKREGQEAQLNQMLMLGLITKEQRDAAMKQQAETAKQHDVTLKDIAKIGAESRMGVAEFKAGAKGKLPAAIGSKFMENSQNLRMAENALDLVERNKSATGLKGYLPDPLLQRTDPEGVDTRAAIANLGSMVIHDRSGAAVTASEFPRLRPFIPSTTDDPETVKKKLQQFVTEYRKINNEMTDFYKESGYDIPENWHQSGGAAAASAGQSAPTATGPDGKKLIYKDGQWQPLQ